MGAVAGRVMRVKKSEMEEWMQGMARHIALGIEGVAVLVIAGGSIEALLLIARGLATGGRASEARVIWMRYAHWLVAGLTFQLAADVVSTTVGPDWTRIGHVAAIAAIRTFLTYFLDRDIERVRSKEAARAMS
jgi:uncharacterized membrane protein